MSHSSVCHHPPRVLVVAPEPFYEDRGTPIAVRQAVEAMTQLGFAVDLLTYPVGQSPEIPGVRYLRVANPLRFRAVPIGLSARKLALDALLVAALERQLRRVRYAFVHAVEEAAFPAVVLGHRQGVPVVYDMQSSLPEQLRARALFSGRRAQRVLRACERWLLGRADVVVTSAGLAELVRRTEARAQVREWRFSSEWEPVPGGSAATLRRELRIAPDARVVLYTGTFAPYQGLEQLVQAMREVRRAVPRTVLVLVGAEDGAHDLRALARTHGLTGALRVVARQPRELVGGYLAMADVLVSPRAYGGNLPLKIFDYLAAGRPIVATDIPTHRSVLDEGRSVLVQQTPSALAMGVVSLLRDPERAARLSESALAYAREHLSWLAFVRSVAELCQAALASRHGGAGEMPPSMRPVVAARPGAAGAVDPRPRRTPPSVARVG